MKHPMVVRGSALVLGLAFLAVPASGSAVAPPAEVPAMVPTAAYGGFATSATATPLRVEVHEPAIPIPADPQAELNFSYTHVEASSGPTSSGRASAMWPGAAVGEGLKTIIEQLGLPSALASSGYPVQVNAQNPGDPASASQEPLPGMVNRVNATDTHTVAKASYTTNGDVPGAGDPSAAPSGQPDLLGLLKSGNLAALGDLLTGSAQSSGGDDVPATNPLGALSLLVSVGGMSGASRTDYVGDTVSATATSEIGDLSLLAGLVNLTGVKVNSTATSSLAGGKTTQKVTYGGITIAGNAFAFTSDGLEATGKTTAIPGLSETPLTALKQLGISIDLPKPTHSVDGTHGIVAATGPTITLDTQPLISLLQLNKLPIGDLVNKLPDSAGQAKGLLLAAAEAHPKVIISLGSVTAEAATIAPIDIGTSSGSGTPGTTTNPPAAPTGSPAGTGNTGSTGGSPDLGAAPGNPLPAVAGGPVSANINPVSAIPGLPPLGSVPSMLILLGLLIAGGAAWYFRRAAMMLFGAGSTCPHGLKAGVPDLRKV